MKFTYIIMMMMNLIQLSVLCVSVVSATLNNFNVEPVSTVNVTQYLGRWYQISASLTVNSTFEAGGYCITANYGLYPNDTISVHNSQRQGNITGPFNDIYGWAQATDSSHPAELTVHLNGVEFGAPYWIILLGNATFYNETTQQYPYAVVSDGLELTLFVLARNVSEFKQYYEAEVYSTLNSIGYNKFWNEPIPTTQEGCVYEV